MPPGIHLIFRVATIDLSFQYFLSLQNWLCMYVSLLKQISRIQLFFLFNVSWAWKISQPEILVNLTYLLLAANFDFRFLSLAKLVIRKVASHACFSHVLYLAGLGLVATVSNSGRHGCLCLLCCCQPIICTVLGMVMVNLKHCPNENKMTIIKKRRVPYIVQQTYFVICIKTLSKPTRIEYLLHCVWGSLGGFPYTPQGLPK